MPADIDTKWLIDHIDKKFADADLKRSGGLEIVHRKIDEHAREARESLDAFRGETTAAIGSLAVEIGKHAERIGSIEKEKAAAEEAALGAEQEASARRHDWARALFASIAGGGGLIAFWHWLTGEVAKK